MWVKSDLPKLNEPRIDTDETRCFLIMLLILSVFNPCESVALFFLSNITHIKQHCAPTLLFPEKRKFFKQINEELRCEQQRRLQEQLKAFCSLRFKRFTQRRSTHNGKKLLRQDVAVSAALREKDYFKKRPLLTLRLQRFVFRLAHSQHKIAHNTRNKRPGQDGQFIGVLKNAVIFKGQCANKQAHGKADTG